MGVIFWFVLLFFFVAFLLCVLPQTNQSLARRVAKYSSSPEAHLPPLAALGGHPEEDGFVRQHGALRIQRLRLAPLQTRPRRGRAALAQPRAQRVPAGCSFKPLPPPFLLLH